MTIDDPTLSILRPGTTGADPRVEHPKLLTATASVSVGLHLMAASALEHGPWMQAAMAIVGIACIPCIIVAWRSCTRRPLGMMITISIISFLFHAGMLVTTLGGLHSKPHHITVATAAYSSHQAAHSAGAAVSLEFLMASEMALIFLATERYGRLLKA